MTGTVHIGKAAKLARVSAGGYRLFDGEDIHDLTFVRHAQELGFSLTEVKELMPLRRKHHVCSEVQSMLNHKLGAVRDKINSLARLEAELADALRSCNRELRLKREIKHEDCCPLLMNLDRVNASNGNKHVSDRRNPSHK